MKSFRIQGSSPINEQFYFQVWFNWIESAEMFEVTTYAIQKQGDDEILQVPPIYRHLYKLYFQLQEKITNISKILIKEMRNF